MYLYFGLRITIIPRVLEAFIALTFVISLFFLVYWSTLYDFVRHAY